MMPQLQREADVAAPDSTSQWSTIQKIGFRFAFSYFLLYVAPGPIGSLSSYDKFKSVGTGFWDWLWHPTVAWVGTSILHLSGNLQEVPNGSGDELYDYVLWLCIAVLATVVTVIWSIADRKRTNYRQLNAWLRLGMRMIVGWGMLGYGVKKLVGSQFTPPTLARLMQPYRLASPTGLLWTFMGASQPYSFFGGLGETLGGVLILLPGLVTLGSIFSLLMMTNVLMLNLSYDVPRKIFSIHLILMCLYLLLPEMQRLTNVFLLNRRAEPVPEIALFRDRQWNRMVRVLPLLFGLYVIVVAGRQSLRDAADLKASLPAPIKGVWMVQDFMVDGVPEVPRRSDPQQWQSVVFDQPHVFTIQAISGNQSQYYMQLDDAQKNLQLWNVDEPNWRGKLHVEYPQADQMALEGRFGAHAITATLSRADLSNPENFYLPNRGFHWINDHVNNR